MTAIHCHFFDSRRIGVDAPVSVDLREMSVRSTLHLREISITPKEGYPGLSAVSVDSFPTHDCFELTIFQFPFGKVMARSGQGIAKDLPWSRQLNYSIVSILLFDCSSILKRITIE